MFWSNRHKQLLLLLFLLFFLFLPILGPLFHSGFFVSDDGEWMVIRLTAFHQALASGQFPVRFTPRLNHGYGYPVLNFLYPGGFYLGEFFHLMGANFVDSVKLVFGFSTISAGFFSFLWLKRRFSLPASLLGSLFYVYSPYFLWDIYKRGSMGEVLSLAFVPLFFWSVEKKNWWVGGLAYGLLILSHNTIAFIFTPFLIVYFLLTNQLSKSTIYHLIFTIFLGLSLSAFFWLPAIFESNLTVLGKTVVSNPLEHFVKDVSLFGRANLVVFFLALLIFLMKKKRLVGFFLLVYLLGLVFSSQASSFLWQVFPWTFLIQFPFRFLSLTLPAAAFLAAFVLDESFQRRKTLWLLAGLAILFYFSLPLTKPIGFFQKDEGFYLTNEHTTTTHDEYMPRWVKVKPDKRPKEKIEVIEGQAKTELRKNTGRQIEFKTSSTIPTKIRVNTIYYPGWQVLVDRKIANFSYQNEKGVIEIPIQKGEHNVSVEFRETPFRALSDIISLASLGVVAFVGVRKLRQTRRR